MKIPRLLTAVGLAATAAFVLASQPWVSYQSPAGVYTIAFPSNPKVTKKASAQFAIESASLDAGKVSYEAIMENYAKIPEFEKDPVGFLDDAILRMRKQSWQPTDVKAFQVNGCPGRLATFKRDGKQMRTYLIAAGMNMVIVSVNGPTGTLESADTAKYFNSFHLK